MSNSLKDYGAGRVVIAGREYITVELVMRPKKAGAKGKTYLQYVATIPKPVALKLYEIAGEKPDTTLTLTTYLSPAPWYTGLLWSKNDKTYKRLPPDIKKELTALGINPEDQDQTILVIAKKKQLEKLGLNPDKPITLEELQEKIIEKHIKKIAVSQPA